MKASTEVMNLLMHVRLNAQKIARLVDSIEQDEEAVLDDSMLETLTEMKDWLAGTVDHLRDVRADARP